MTETRSRDSYHDAPATGWAHRRTRPELTKGEANAARAMRDRCVAELRRVEAELLAAPEAPIDAAAHWCHAAELLARLEPAAEEDGLSGRGA